VVDGEPNPQDILRLLGVEPLAAYLVKEIRTFTVCRASRSTTSTSRRSPVDAARVRSPMPAVPVTWLASRSAHPSDRGKRQGRGPQRTAGCDPVLLGITKASLATNHYLAASFGRPPALTEVRSRLATAARPQGKRHHRPPDPGRYKRLHNARRLARSTDAELDTLRSVSAPPKSVRGSGAEGDFGRVLTRIANEMGHDARVRPGGRDGPSRLTAGLTPNMLICLLGRSHRPLFGKVLQHGDYQSAGAQAASVRNLQAPPACQCPQRRVCTQLRPRRRSLTPRCARWPRFV
jgi:hypothetical protein